MPCRAPWAAFGPGLPRATTLEENIKKLAQMPLIAHPGTMFDYSNNSVDTLCRLVEVMSGTRLRHTAIFNASLSGRACAK